MSQSSQVPRLRRHKGKALGYVRFGRTDVYFEGRWPANQKQPPPEIKAAYDRTIAEWLARGRQLPPPSGQPQPKDSPPASPPDTPTTETTTEASTSMPSGLTVSELAVRFMAWAGQHYRRPDDSQTIEVVEFRMSLRVLVHLYGHLAVSDIGPLKLKAVRELMVSGYKHPKHGEQASLSRGVVNHRCSRLVRVFRWGVSEELVAETVWRALTTVKGLQAGRSDARETEPIKPVPLEVVEKTLPNLTSHLHAAVKAQMFTGARADEILPLRGCDLDTSGEIWVYRVPQHKGSWRGEKKVILIGPRGQAALMPLLKVRCPECGTFDRAGRIGWCETAPLCGPCRDRVDEAGTCGPWPAGLLSDEEQTYFVFSPKDAMADRDKERRAKRKTKVQPSQQKSRKHPGRRLAPGERYPVDSYNQAIKRAAERAGVEHWSSHQLRHLAGTLAREKYGLEGAQHLLGHKKANITELYAEKNLALALKLAKEIG